MKRLSVARDRELRHVRAQQIAWRWSFHDGVWYPWCRVCGRNARQQIDWLIKNDYVLATRNEYVSTVNVQFTGEADAYLERFPR